MSCKYLIWERSEILTPVKGSFDCQRGHDQQVESPALTLVSITDFVYIFKNIYLIFNYVQECILMCRWHMCVLALRGQKMASSPLHLELHAAVIPMGWLPAAHLGCTARAAGAPSCVGILQPCCKSTSNWEVCAQEKCESESCVKKRNLVTQPGALWRRQ